MHAAHSHSEFTFQCAVPEYYKLRQNTTTGVSRNTYLAVDITNYSEARIRLQIAPKISKKDKRVISRQVSSLHISL